MSASLILFNDFETTGTDTTKDVILEGYFDLRLFVPEEGIFAKQLLTQHVYVDSVYDRATMNPFAEKMHTESGLWDDLEANSDSTMTIAAFDSIFTPAIAAAKKEYEASIINLGGMGVANYDKRLIERDMIQLDSLLHYRCEDISIVRMNTQRSGWKPGPEDGHIFHTVAHRAKGDVEQGIAQFIYFNNMNRRAIGLDPITATI